MNRRQFLTASIRAIGAASVLTGLYTWRIEPHWVQFVRRPLPIPNLPRDLAGRTLVLLSDLHVGPRVEDAYVIHTLQRVAALEPDFVVCTGDFISYQASDQLDQLGAVLKHFPHGRLTTIAVLGNHDYGPGWAHPEIADLIVAEAGQAGITVLRNESTMASGLQFVGLDDLWARQFKPHIAFTGADPAAATVALSHNPDTVDRRGWESHRGWILSGHTHGGQCKPPFLPPPLLPVANRRYTAGEFSLQGARSLYISRGVGHLLRVRFNVRPEVTMFQLLRAEPSRALAA